MATRAGGHDARPAAVGAPARPALLAVLASAVFLTVLGALDDAHALPVSWRLIGQALAALALAFSLPQGFRLLPDLMPLVVERALLVFGIVWFVNAVNFLDGLDWMTVAQVVPMTLGIAALQALGAVPATIGLLALALLGATLGFALFNKHPAKIFLGDAGSLPIGLMPRLHADLRGASPSWPRRCSWRSTRWPIRRSRCSAASPPESRSSRRTARISISAPSLRA